MTDEPRRKTTADRVREWRASQNPELRDEVGGDPTLSVIEEFQLRLLAAGDDGVTLAELRASRSTYGRSRHNNAIQVLRQLPTVVETRERRPDARGTLRVQVVLRLGDTNGG